MDSKTPQLPDFDSFGYPKPQKNIYVRGAENGAWLGLYFIVLMALAVKSLTVPVLNLPATVLALCVPLITYYFLRRTHVEAHGFTSYAALWMQGIMMFACGSLILAAVMMIYLKWLAPGFITEVVNIAIDTYESSDLPDADQLAETLTTMRDNHMLPTAFSMAMAWMWMGMFSGSLLSMIVAGIARIKKVD